MTWFNTLKTRWTDLLAEYGKIAIGTYLVLWLGVWLAFGIAIGLGIDIDGVDPASATTVGSVVFASWLAAKITQPVRIAATLVMTPFVATLFRRLPMGHEE